MEQLVTQLSTSDYVALGVGVALLVVGRKLFWLALGGVGFLAGVWLAGNLLDLSSGLLELGIGLLLGIACTFLAIFAQKIAVALAGFVLGGSAALWAASFFESQLAGQPELLLLGIALVGAILGLVIAPALFEASLAAVTSLIGALLIVSSTGVGPPHETWLFVGLLLFGLIVQSAGRRRRVRRQRLEPRSTR